MSWLQRLFGLGSARKLPPIVPTDEVVPCNFFDDTSYLREYQLMWMYRFAEVLDPEKLNVSLCQLFEMEGWRRLGGRFRLRPDGKAEIHIPCPFTEERPPLYFTKEAFDIRLEEHPEAAKLPRAGESPSTFLSPRNFQSLGVDAGAPRCFEDYFYSDLPQFSLHVVTFTDATLVSIGFSHVTSDLGGLSAIVNAWSLILAGKPEAVPPFAGFREDGMAPLYKEPGKEPYVFADKQLTGWRMALWGLRFLFEGWWRPTESRTVCIPKKTMDALVDDARSHLSTAPKAEGAPAPFISEGDVLAALVTRSIAESLPEGSNRQITNLMAVDPRGRAKSALRSEAAYVQNCPSGAFFHYNSATALSQPLGRIALACREGLMAQLTEDQLKTVANICYKAITETGSPAMFGDTDMYFFTMSNWSKAKFFDLMDFSPAIVKAARNDSGKGHKMGHPVFWHSQSLDKGSFSATVCTIIGRDPEGDLWMVMDSPSPFWPRLLGWLDKYHP